MFSREVTKMSIIINKIEQVALDTPNKIALFEGDNVISYIDLVNLIEEKVDYLTLNNVTSLALYNLTNLDWIITDLACLKLNILCIPIPNFFTKEQILNALEKSGVEFILKTDNLEQLDSKKSRNLKAQKITFTSGSTGNPKGVCLSVDNIEKVVESLDDRLNDSAIKVHSSLLPYSILLENIAGLYLSLYRGGCVDYSMLKAINGEDIFNKLEESQADSVILVPELLKLLVGYMKKSNKKLPKLKFAAVGGAKVSNELLEQAKLLGLPVYQGYGLSENCSVVALNNATNNKIGSVGKVLPHVKYHIASDGELFIDNPQFAGYTGQNIKGSYATGDLAEIDKEGYLYITGRKKNIVITSMGRNVSPEWPESILLSNSKIAQALVFGDASKSLKALIVPTTDVDVEEIKSMVNEKLPEYAHLEEIIIVENFAKNNLLTGNMRPKRDAILKFYNIQ